MTMNYHPKINYKKNKKFINPALFLLVFFISIKFFFSISISNATNNLIGPFIRAGAGINNDIGLFLNYFSSKKSLKIENDKLRKSINIMAVKELKYKIMRDENIIMKNSLRIYGDIGSYTIARVTAKPPFSPYDILILDSGSNSGISIGQRVYFSEDVILGEIVEVYTNSSKARLYSSYGTITKAKIEGQGIFFSLLGRGMGNFRIEAPRDLQITKGDILTAGDEPGKIIGEVHGVSTGPTDAFQLVHARYPINFLDVIYVGIK